MQFFFCKHVKVSFYTSVDKNVGVNLSSVPQRRIGDKNTTNFGLQFFSSFLCFSWPSLVSFVCLEITPKRKKTSSWQCDKKNVANLLVSDLKTWLSIHIRQNRKRDAVKHFFSTLKTHIFVFLMTQIRLKPHREFKRWKLKSKRVFVNKNVIFYTVNSQRQWLYIWPESRWWWCFLLNHSSA